MAAALPDAQSAAWAEEAAHWHWMGAVLLQVHLHDADVTALPPPPPFLLSGPRIGYFPLLVSIIKAHFSSSLPPGVDTVWFEYKGLPLKWYTHWCSLRPSLCGPRKAMESNVAIGHPSVYEEWKAAFIITGNSKNVMNMSQADQLAMWESVRKRDADSYMNISTKLKLGPFEEDFLVRTSSLEPRQGSDEPESPGSVKPCRVPVRLYVRRVEEELEYLEDVIPVSDWESVSYINRPLEIRKEGGRRIITLGHALEALLPEYFSPKPTASAAGPEPTSRTPGCARDDPSSTPGTPLDREPAWAIPREMVVAKKARVKLVRIHGMDFGADTPFLWVANNLSNPEFFLHVCVYIGA